MALNPKLDQKIEEIRQNRYIMLANFQGKQFA